jgi:hypothetical protein
MRTERREFLRRGDGNGMLALLAGAGFPGGRGKGGGERGP